MKQITLLLLLFVLVALPGNMVAKKKKEVKPQTELRINPYYWNKQVVNHRGWHECPENTLTAIDEAIHRGFKILECDIAFTKDSVPILSHDPTLTRCTNFKGNTTDYTIDEMAIIDFGVKKGQQFKGTHVSTLKEALILCRRNNVIIELDCANKKRFPNDKYKIVYDLVKRYDMLGSTIFVDDADNLTTLLDIDENVLISVAHCSNKDEVEKYLPIAKRAKAAAFSFRYNFVTRDLINYVHDQGMNVKIWTVDSLEELKKYVGWGADQITSNKLGPNFDYRISSIIEND